MLGPAVEVTALGQPLMQEVMGTEWYEVCGQVDR